MWLSTQTRFFYQYLAATHAPSFSFSGRASFSFLSVRGVGALRFVPRATEAAPTDPSLPSSTGTLVAIAAARASPVMSRSSSACCLATTKWKVRR
jgi:hypothetical protein